MAYNYGGTLNPQKGLIWRIVHRENLQWIFDNGLHCGSSSINSPGWVNIGNPELTDKRSRHIVPIGPGGHLNDYVPFYFTPFSPMLKNINSGWGGIKQLPNEEIVILVSSLPKLQSMGINFVFTDSHAYYQWANFYTELQDLQNIDWGILQTREFKRDPNDPAKFERYQAEALVHRHCPVDALEGVICYTEHVKQVLDGWLKSRQLNLPIHARTGWYF